MQQKQKKYKIKPETYTSSSSSQNSTNNKQEQITEQQPSPQKQYDYFTRQKQIELNKDYRKLREQAHYIPEDIGKGGFDELVYWSEFAKTPEQISNLVRLFNRCQISENIQKQEQKQVQQTNKQKLQASQQQPKQKHKKQQIISDRYKFQQFLEKVMNTVYLSTNYNTLQQYSTFGQRYNIRQPTYWKKIQQKTIRLNPKTPQQIKDCIEIAFVMSKIGYGQLIYSSLSYIFRDVNLTTQDTAKLMITYANTQTGDKQWIDKLKKDLILHIDSLNKQIFIETLPIFKKIKNISDQQQNKIINKISQFISQLNFKQVCIVGSFIQHGKMDKQFWNRVQTRLKQVLPKTTNNIPTYNIVYLIQLLSNYSISPQFVKQHFIPIIKSNNYKILEQLPPQILSSISKLLYIYQLDSNPQSQKIQQKIQTIIMKTFNSLKNVQIQALIKVIKDYAVTRIGSRELYIFLEQVADALFQEIKENRQYVQMLCVVYENSQLCTPEFLERLQQCL